MTPAQLHKAAARNHAAYGALLARFTNAHLIASNVCLVHPL
jgi:hypothetical protein